VSMPEVVELTRDLVRIKSENPGNGESEIALFVAQWLKRNGVPEVQVDEASPGRPNVIARIPGDPSLPPLALIAHMDTVPAGEGWTVDPFGGDIIDGKLYGRGAADMKGGLAASMVAAKNIANSARGLKRTLLMCGTADEEGTHMLGAVDLVQKGIINEDTLVIAPECTGMNIIICHKGVMWFELTAKGKMSHAGTPEVGVDAIYGIAELVREVKNKIEELTYRHDLLGKPTVTFGVIRGGLKTNVVPDRCAVEIDVRAVPPMTVKSVTELLRKVANRAPELVPGLSATVRQINIDRPPVESAPSSPVLQVLLGAYTSIMNEEAGLHGFRVYTDASIISHLTGNKDAFVFGPGAIEQAHTADEYVETSQLLAAERILTKTVEMLCL